MGERRSERTCLRMLGAAVALGLTLASPPAWSQADDELRNKAKQDWNEALSLMAAEKYNEALAKFRAVSAYRMTPQVAFNIAECEEKLGRLVGALGNYRLAESEAAGKPDTEEVARSATTRIADLEKRIPMLTIQRGENALEAEILLDGVTLGPAQIGSAIRVDPGKRVITAKVAEVEVFKGTVTLKEATQKTISVDIKSEDLEAGASAGGGSGGGGEGSASSSGGGMSGGGEGTPDRPEEGGSGAGGYVMLGVGLAGLAAGGVFFFLRQGTIQELDDACGGDLHCPVSMKETADKGKLYTGLTMASGGIGLIGVVTGIVLLSSGGGETKQPAAEEEGTARVRVLPAAPGAAAGVSLLGRF